MSLYSDNILWALVFSYGIYSILVVPFFCSKIFVKFGETERFWYIIIVLLNVYILIYILSRSKYRLKLATKEKALIVSFFSCYFLFLIFIWRLMSL